MNFSSSISTSNKLNFPVFLVYTYIIIEKTDSQCGSVFRYTDVHVNIAQTVAHQNDIVPLRHLLVELFILSNNRGILTERVYHGLREAGGSILNTILLPLR